MKLRRILYLLHVIQHVYNYYVHFERTQDECYRLFGIPPEAQRLYGYVTLTDYVGTYKQFLWRYKAHQRIQTVKEANRRAREAINLSNPTTPKPEIKVVLSTAIPQDYWFMTNDQQLLQRLEEHELYSTLVKRSQGYQNDDGFNVMESNPYEGFYDPDEEEKPIRRTH